MQWTGAGRMCHRREKILLRALVAFTWRWERQHPVKAATAGSGARAALTRRLEPCGTFGAREAGWVLVWWGILDFPFLSCRNVNWN